MDVIHRTVSIARTASAIVIYQLILDPTRGDTLPTYRDDTLLDLTTRYSVLRPLPGSNTNDQQQNLAVVVYR